MIFMKNLFMFLCTSQPDYCLSFRFPIMTSLTVIIMSFFPKLGLISHSEFLFFPNIRQITLKGIQHSIFSRCCKEQFKVASERVSEFCLHWEDMNQSAVSTAGNRSIMHSSVSTYNSNHNCSKSFISRYQSLHVQEKISGSLSH